MVAPHKARSATKEGDAARPVLITGFDPFGGSAVNPSWLVAQRLQGFVVEGRRIVAAQVPTRFGAALQRLQALLEQERPQLVICLGLAPNRRVISVERVAINVNDARIPDNAGAQPIDTPVVAGGPAAYFSSLPIKAIRAALQDADIPVEVSQTAGTFVCNHIFYGLMHAFATQVTLQGVRGGFMHVPPLPEQAADGMPLARMERGLRIAVRTALTTQRDLVCAAGAVD